MGDQHTAVRPAPEAPDPEVDTDVVVVEPPMREEEEEEPLGWLISLLVEANAREE